MNTQMTRLDNDDRKTNRMACPLFKTILLLGVALNTLPSAMADATEQIPTSSISSQIESTEILAKPGAGIEIVRKLTRSEREVKLATQSILNMMMIVQNNNSQISSVKVPSYNYRPILQELQNQNAKFLLPGASIPPEAKAVFQLQSEESGLSQTVYFL